MSSEPIPRVVPAPEDEAPSGLGDEEVGLGAPEAEPLLDALDGASWLDADEASDVEPPDFDEASEASALDDAPSDVPIGPLEVDDEARWTEGSEADDGVERTPLDEPPEEPRAASDDGAEGLADEDAAPELPAGDGLDERAELAGQDADETLDEGRLDAPPDDDAPAPASNDLVGLGGHEGEAVEVRRGEVRIGRHAVQVGLELAGALVLDDEHLLCWTDAGAARLLRTDGSLVAEVPVEVRKAAADGRGGALVVDRAGRLVPLVRRGEAVRPEAPRLALPALSDVAIAGGETFLLAGERLFALPADGALVPLGVGGPARALGVDGRGRLVLAHGVAEGIAVERWWDGRGARRERLGVLAVPAGEVRAVAALEHGVWLLVGDRRVPLGGRGVE